MKRIAIIGASSGLGREVALRYIAEGWTVGLAARRIDELEKIRLIAPERIFIEQIDITATDSSERILQLIERMGGMDFFLNSSGVGWQNPELELQTELSVAAVNVDGFMRSINSAFTYFKQHGGGHIAAISSVAGTKGIGNAAAYSSTKRFQSTYIQALSQLSHMHHLNITFTDIRPGFVATPILNKEKHYPFLMQPAYAAAQIVSAINHRKRVKTINWKFRLFVFIWRLIPNRLWERMTLIKN